MNWLDWLDGEPKTTGADPDPHGYGPFICQQGNVEWNREYNAARNAPGREKEAGE